MRALNRVAKISTSAEALKLFDRQCTVELFERYLAKCEELRFTEPNRRENVAMARVACLVANRLEGDYFPQSLAVLGSALQVVGRLRGAEAAFNRALQLAITSWTRGDVLQRRSRLLADLGRLDQALVDAEEAVSLRRSCCRFDGRESDTLASALVFRGYVHHSAGRLHEAITDFGDALAETTPSLTPRTYTAAIYNFLVLQEMLPRTSETMRKLLGQLKRAIDALPKSWHAYQRVRLQWARAIVFHLLGSSRMAEKILARVRPQLLKVDIRDYLCASLDLVDVYRFHGNSSGVVQIFQEMVAAARLVPEGAALTAAAAASSLSDEQLETVLSGLRVGLGGRFSRRA